MWNNKKFWIGIYSITFLIMAVVSYALDLTRVKEWTEGETLTATALNAEFDNILDHSITDADVSSIAAITASKLNQAVAGAIGGTTPNAGTFTTLSSTGTTTIGDATGDAFTINPSAWTLANAVTITGTWANLGTVTTGTFAALLASADLDIGSYELRAQTLESDVATGTAPFTIASTTKSTNLNADLLDGYNTATTASAATQIYVSGSDGYLPDATVDTTALKTATGEVTLDLATAFGTGGGFGVIGALQNTTGSYATIIWCINRDASGNLGVTLPGGTYAFFPQTYQSGNTGYWQTRYVTASGEDLWIFLLLDKTTKEIISAYQAPDHPAYGNGGDFDKLPHPFGSYDTTRHEIILLDKETCLVLKTESEQTGKSILTLVNEEYKPNMVKEEIYQPLHSGKFLDKKPELVQTIPDYIKVRKLEKLTQIEKDTKEAKRQQAIQKKEQEKVKKQQDRNTAISKLETLGLKSEEIEALIQ